MRFYLVQVPAACEGLLGQGRVSVGEVVKVLDEDVPH